MIKKRKGSALIMTLCIIALLSVLTMVIVTESTSAYKLTVQNEKKEQTFLMAESGIQKGLSSLKQIIALNPSILTSVVSSDSDITYKDGSSTSFTFGDSSINESVTVKFIDSKKGGEPCIKIESQATSTEFNTKKTLVSYILKKDISNIYNDTFINNVFTVIDDKDNSGDTSFYISSHTPLNLYGSMYLQGDNIWLIPSNDFSVYQNGETVTVNSNRLQILTYEDDSTFGYNFPADPTLKNMIKLNPNAIVDSYCDDWRPEVKQLNDTEVKNSINKFSEEPKDLKPLVLSSEYDYKFSKPKQPMRNNFYSYNVFSEDILDSSNINHKIAVMKVRKKPEWKKDNTIKWADLASNTKEYVMREVLGYTPDRFGYYSGAQEAEYEKVYKLFLIEGDVSADTKLLSNNSFLNHIIYSTGKFTVGGNFLAGLKSITFYNTSIIAKQIEIQDLGLDALVGNGSGIFINEFDPNFKDVYTVVLNKYFLENLDSSYAEKMKFKYVMEEN